MQIIKISQKSSRSNLKSEPDSFIILFFEFFIELETEFKLIILFVWIKGTCFIDYLSLEEVNLINWGDYFFI
jgi:hypothetical protein